MLYCFARILMRVGLRFFYRHVYVTGMEHIPSQGPVIIIANHPSSLMDAALLGVLLKRPLWYFTRGDVFINRPVRQILSWLHMIPVHQHIKGRATLNDNNDSFRDARSILAGNGIIVFFPESTSHTGHQLLPFRKGVFRLAFQTMADHDFRLRLPVVPIGLTYDHPTAGRQCVQVHAGPPLQMEDYTALYLANPSAALLRILKDAEERIAGKALHIADTGRCGVAGQCLTLYRNDHPPRAGTWKIASQARLAEEQAICRYINGINEAALTVIQKKNTAYFDALEQYGLEDKTIAAMVVRGDTNHGGRGQAQDNMNFGGPGTPQFSPWKRLLLWIGFPLSLAGMVLNALPVWIARRIAGKIVRRDDFYSWVFVCGYCLLYFAWMLALVITAVCFSWKYAAALIPVMALTGLFSYQWFGWRQEARQHGRLKRLSRQQLMHLEDTRPAIAPRP